MTPIRLTPAQLDAAFPSLVSRDELARVQALADRAFALALAPGIRWPPVPLQLAGLAEVARLRAPPCDHDAITPKGLCVDCGAPAAAHVYAKYLRGRIPRDP